MHHVVADRRVTAPEQRQHAATVLPGGGRQRLVQEVGAGCQQIGEAHKLVAAAARLDHARPARDEGDAMAAIPGIRLVAAESGTRMVSLRLHLVDADVRRAAVVAGEDHQGIVGDAVALQGVEDLAEHVVGFHYQVGVEVVQSAAPDPAFVHRQRRVRRGHRQIEEERHSGGSALGDVAIGGTGERGQELLEVPVGHRRALQAGQIVAEQPSLQEFGGNTDGGVVVEVAVRRPVGNIDAEVVVEAAGGGAAGDPAGERVAPQIPLPVGRLRIGDRGCIIRARRQEVLGGRKVPTHAEMPLADGAAVVAVALQQLADREPPPVDQRRPVGGDDALLQRRPPVVAAGEHAVAGRRADRGAGVGVPAHHPLARQPIELRRSDPAARVEAGDIAIAHIVDQKVDDVRSQVTLAVGNRWRSTRRPGGPG